MVSNEVSTDPPAQPEHVEGAAAGWYLDPAAPQDPGRRRWWDGATWGDHMVWSGSGWVDVDVRPDAAASGPRRRVWLWVVLVAAVLAVGGCGVLVLVGIGMDAALTHDLVDTDFSVGSEPFAVGSDPDAGAYAFELVDGAYRIRATGPNEEAASSVGEYARTAYSVDTMVEVVDVSAGSTIAAGCLSRDLFGYTFSVGPEGAVLHRTATDGRREVATAEDARLPEAPFTLEIDCEQSLSNMNDLDISGWIDGRRVLSFTDTEAVSGFAFVELGLRPDSDDARATFGDVVAVVPGG